jgi:hypothetical protein
MKVVIPIDAPELAEASYWQKLLSCSRITIYKAEKAGLLVAASKRKPKLYSKVAILRWLGVNDA